VHDRVGLVHALDASGMEFGQVVELVGKLVGLGSVCLGCMWLAVQGKLLYRKSCCAGKAAVLSFTVWQFDWLSNCMLSNCLKYP
jgi:hypothetical protein